MSSIPTGGRIFCVNNLAITLTTAITLIQIKAVTNPIWLLRASCGQDGNTVSQQERIRILRKTVAATVTAFTPLKYDPDDSASLAVGNTAGTGITGTAEGTDGDILVARPFNVLNGFEWIATPMEMIKVPPGGIIAMKFPATVVSQLWSMQMVYCEA